MKTSIGADANNVFNTAISLEEKINGRTMQHKRELGILAVFSSAFLNVMVRRIKK
jgi:hypothetical protein